MNKLNLKAKLLIAFLAVGIVPFSIMGGLSLKKSSSALSQAAFDKLEAVQTIKKNQIERYFAERIKDITILTKSMDLQKMYDTVLKYHNDTNVQKAGPYDVTTAAYKALYEKNAGYLNSFNREYGYYDTFVICAAHGHVMYSATKKNDLGTNLVYGPYKDSGLAKLWRKVVDTDQITLQDFEPYAPSNGEPAAFMGAPIKKNGQTVAVIAVQLSLESINTIMTERIGMGQTGESYLVGPDNLMRSDSFLDPEHHSVRASFRDPVKGSVDTKASRKALGGQSGMEIITDYNGNPVLSAYSPIKAGELTWALLAEIDKAEAFAPVRALQWVALSVAGIGIFGIVLVAFLISQTIARPVRNVVVTLTNLAQGEGDLTLRLPVATGDEIGQLAHRFNEFMSKLHSMIGDITKGMGTLSTSSTELSAISQQMSVSAEHTSSKCSSVAAAAEEMSANMGSVSAAMKQTSTNTGMVATAAEQMTATINEIAKNTENARNISGQAVHQTKDAGERMSSLGHAAQAIGKVTETINEISEQTNLLALNATIEAARAGEAGKGFAVVANEIKALAKQTAEATLDIRQQIDDIQNSTGGTVENIQQVGKVINHVNEIVTVITTAVEEQSISTKEIAENISQVSDGVVEVDANVAQSSAVAGDITQSVAEINEAAGEMAKSSSQVRLSADELSQLAEQLNKMVGRFKI